VKKEFVRGLLKNKKVVLFLKILLVVAGLSLGMLIISNYTSSGKNTTNPDSSVNKSYYLQEIGINVSGNSFAIFKGYDIFLNVKYIMPDSKVAYLDELFFNQTTPIGLCNAEMNDCYIYNAYRKVINETDLCVVMSTRWGDKGIEDSSTFTQKFYNNPSDCLKKVETESSFD